MRMQTLQLVPILVLTGYAQTEPAVTREGGYWVQTVSGSLAVGHPGLRLQIRGSLHLHGEDRGDIFYSLKKRVRARNEADARRRLGQIDVRLAQGGPRPTLTVNFPDGEANGDLTVAVDRKLRDLSIESQGGSVEARDLDGALKVDIGGGNVQLDRIAGLVSVRTGGGNVVLGHLGGALNCISGGGNVTADSIGGSASVRTGGGNILLKEVGGAVRAFTGGGGNVRVEHAGGGVAVESGGGLIDVLRAGGAVTAETGAGAIRVQTAKSVRCETGVGAVKVLQVSGGMHVSTANGAIVAELAAGLEDSFLSTALGDITVFIPSNLAVTVQALADSQGLRKIISDFPEICTRPEARGARAEAQGSLNGGGPVLRVAATGGTVYLRRQGTEHTERAK